MTSSSLCECEFGVANVPCHRVSVHGTCGTEVCEQVHFPQRLTSSRVGECMVSHGDVMIMVMRECGECVSSVALHVCACIANLCML
jgi:hypothetical protein